MNFLTKQKDKKLCRLSGWQTESLIGRVFSSQSDVWSYGVTIWELFSLSKQPYPDTVNFGLADIWIEVNDLADLIRFLPNGKRMDRPELMPRAIGNVMRVTCYHCKR